MSAATQHQYPIGEMRDPNLVMRLDRVGSFFPSRISFIPQLLRRMRRENWQFQRTRFDINPQGEGVALYQAKMGARMYTLIVFSHDLPPEKRTDRVIAEAWDATFTLFDGTPSEDDIARLRQNVPLQEAGRCQATELCLSRANRSVRLFASVSETLARGEQPEANLLTSVGYLMRTTAVYGSGKFGCADRSKIANRQEFRVAFQPEMLAVFLFRWFSIDLVNHQARILGGVTAVELAEPLATSLGIGNSTGLGMSPFLVKHHQLIHRWIMARETALARVRAKKTCTDTDTFLEIFARGREYLAGWRVADDTQTARIATLEAELTALSTILPEMLQDDYPWDALYRHAEAQYSLETQEFLVSQMLEPHGAIIDDLCETMQIAPTYGLDVAQSIATLQGLIETHYDWCLGLNFHHPEQQHHFWYYSEEKLEPRFGRRYEEDGADKEMPLTIARDVQDLLAIVRTFAPHDTIASLLLQHPDQRSIIRRVQAITEYPYGEIRNNLIAKGVRPLDILRLKLSFFGATKFDPKSDLWLRVNMFQGAPLPARVHKTCETCLAWMYPLNPQDDATCCWQHCSKA